MLKLITLENVVTGASSGIGEGCQKKKAHSWKVMQVMGGDWPPFVP
jgi:NADP-dependent 3-hydroxy acid dehydrogenase YdfG